MASETVTVPVTTEVIEVPTEAKTLVIDPPTDGAIIPEPTTNGTAATTTEVPATTEEPKVEEEPKKVIDPREDAIGWIKSLIPAGVHKANHQILSWIHSTAYPTAEEPKPVVPGRDGATTKSQFINFLKDGTVLAKFANVLSPGAIETVHEGEEAKTKENQVANLQGFINFVKDKAGLTEAETFSVDDLQEKGKGGFDAVFNTLFQLGLKVQDKFNATGIDVDGVIAAASQAAKNSIIQAIWNFFKRVRPQLKTKTEATTTPTVEDKPIVNGANGTTPAVVSEEVNGDAAPSDIPPPIPTSAAPTVTAQ